MRLLIRGGKLYRKEGWKKVVEHCLVQVAAADVLSELINLSPKEREEFIKVAACHDWNKRIEIRPADFGDEDMELAKIFLKRVNPRQDLMDATSTSFNTKYLKGGTTFLQRVQSYLDHIVLDSNIVSYDKRFVETAKRSPELGEDYFDRLRKFDRQISLEIFERFPDLVKAKVKSPKNIPYFVRQEIEKKWNKSNG